MASRVHSLNLNGKIPNILLKEQKLKYNSSKLKKFDGNLNDDNNSIENLKKLTRFSSYNESNIKDSANTLKWDDESDKDINLTDNNSGQCSCNDVFSDNNINRINYNKIDNIG